MYKTTSPVGENISFRNISYLFFYTNNKQCSSNHCFPLKPVCQNAVIRANANKKIPIAKLWNKKNSKTPPNAKTTAADL